MPKNKLSSPRDSTFHPQTTLGLIYTLQLSYLWEVGTFSLVVILYSVDEMWKQNKKSLSNRSLYGVWQLFDMRVTRICIKCILYLHVCMKKKNRQKIYSDLKLFHETGSRRGPNERVQLALYFTSVCVYTQRDTSRVIVSMYDVHYCTASCVHIRVCSFN